MIPGNFVRNLLGKYSLFDGRLAVVSPPRLRILNIVHPFVHEYQSSYVGLTLAHPVLSPRLLQPLEKARQVITASVSVVLELQSY